jgi:hypothetical protein
MGIHLALTDNAAVDTRRILPASGCKTNISGQTHRSEAVRHLLVRLAAKRGQRISTMTFCIQRLIRLVIILDAALAQDAVVNVLT